MKTSIWGAFIVASIFRPGEVPDPNALMGQRFFIYHLPQDLIPIRQATETVDFLTMHRARAKMQEYQGLHGWTGNVYKDIQQGIAWIGSEN